MQKGPAKPKKVKEVEKAKPEEKAPEAPAENGEAKADDDVRVMSSYTDVLIEAHSIGDVTLTLSILSYRRQLQTQPNKKMRQQNNISQTASFTSAPCTSFLVQFRGIFLSTIF